MKVKHLMKICPVLLFFLFFSTQNLSAQGHLEFGFHYSTWSIDILRSAIEEGIGDALETELRDRFLEDIQEDHPFLEETSYNQEVSFDSGGNNYGFEIRWYPGGQHGSFSIGLSVEKTTMRVSLPTVSASMSLRDQLTGKTAGFSGEVRNAQFEMSPMSFHLSFRWDIKPSWKVRPYITFGFGAASGAALEEGEFSASWSGDLNIEGEAPEHHEGLESKTLKELRDELEEEGEEFFLPGFLPFIQLNFGIKGALSDNLYILIDAGVWNGLLLRGGIALRI